MIMAYFGHHKCASTYITKIAIEMAIQAGRPYLLTQLTIDPEAGEKITRHNVHFLLSTNTSYEETKQLSEFRGFHVIRDPRDICVSGYFSHLYSHPTEGWPILLEHRKKLKQLDKEAGILEEIKFTDLFLQHIGNWNYDDERILELKMEHLTQDPLRMFTKIFNHLQLMDTDTTVSKDAYKIRTAINRVTNKLNIARYLSIKQGINPTALESHIHNQRFEKLARGRKKGQEDQKSHYRKGVAGDWKNHFSIELKDYFKTHYGQMLIDLGYEKDLDW